MNTDVTTKMLHYQLPYWWYLQGSAQSILIKGFCSFLSKSLEILQRNFTDIFNDPMCMHITVLSAYN